MSVISGVSALPYLDQPAQLGDHTNPAQTGGIKRSYGGELRHDVNA